MPTTTSAAVVPRLWEKVCPYEKYGAPAETNGCWTAVQFGFTWHQVHLRRRRSKCSVYIHFILKLCNIQSSERGNPRALPEEIGWTPWENIEKSGMWEGLIVRPRVIWPKFKVTTEQTPAGCDVPTLSIWQNTEHVKVSQKISGEVWYGQWRA